MKNITTETNYVRVIGNTKDPKIKAMNDMVGQDFEVRTSYYNDDTISVWNKDKSKSWLFNKADVRFLTPAMYKGKNIAIGDEVKASAKWRKVLGFYMYYNIVRISVGSVEDTYVYLESEIKDHRTGAEVVSLSGKVVDVMVDGVSHKAVIQ